MATRLVRVMRDARFATRVLHDVAPALGLSAPACGLSSLPFFTRVQRRRALFSPAPLTFYVKRAASDFVEVVVPASASVAALVDAATTKLRIDAPPGAVTLALEAGGPPLDARRALSDAFDAHALALRPSLLVTVRAPAAEGDDVEEIIRYRLAAPDDAEMEQPVVSAADFDEFRKDKTIWAVRSDVNLKLREVTRLLDARRILATPGLHLLVREKFASLPDEVSRLKRESKNAATSFEQLTNKAVAADAGLRERYGKLMPVNNGEEVVFIDSLTGKDFASYDGLFLNEHGVVLFNESKARLRVEDVAVVTDAHASLSAVAADTARFTSRPADVPLLVKGRTVVPLLSSTVCDKAAAAAAAAARVHVFVKSGAGFVCALAEGEFASG